MLQTALYLLYKAVFTHFTVIILTFEEELPGCNKLLPQRISVLSWYRTYRFPGSHQLIDLCRYITPVIRLLDGFDALYQRFFLGVIIFQSYFEFFCMLPFCVKELVFCSLHPIPYFIRFFVRHFTDRFPFIKNGGIFGRCFFPVCAFSQGFCLFYQSQFCGIIRFLFMMDLLLVAGFAVKEGIFSIQKTIP
ncbi:hypothetical protein FQZ97_974770 [compost metagenome]